MIQTINGLEYSDEACLTDKGKIIFNAMYDGYVVRIKTAAGPRCCGVYTDEAFITLQADEDFRSALDNSFELSSVSRLQITRDGNGNLHPTFVY